MKKVPTPIGPARGRPKADNVASNSEAHVVRPLGRPAQRHHQFRAPETLP